MANSETLRDLIRINNDRVTGYSKAATQTDDQDLQSLFSNLAQQSRQFASDLRRLISDSDKDVTDETTTAGKIYRAWMDVKATFGGDDRHGILASCEFGEDAAQKAYKDALNENDKSDTGDEVLIQIECINIKLKHSWNSVHLFLVIASV